MAIGILSPLYCTAVVIDNFDQDTTLLTATNNYSQPVVLLQTGLATASTIGGTRKLSLETFGEALLQVNSATGELSFNGLTNTAYFTIEYGAESPLGIDLRADGSTAFLLSFSRIRLSS